MARPPRLPLIFQTFDAPLWFITACTQQREPWLNALAIHRALEDFASNGLEFGRAAVGRYVLMPDHLHLFVRLGPDQRLGEWVKALKRALSDATVRASSPTPKRWQPGFFDHLLRHTESYAEKWNYVWQNPVRAGLVQDADEWPYQGECCTLPYD